MINLKKFNCLILCVVLVFTTMFSTTLSVSAETVKIGVITGSSVRMRADATTSSDILYQFGKAGTAVTVLGSKTSGAYTWYQVSHTAESKKYIGYIRGDYLSVNEFTIDADFKNQLNDFPEDYHNDLTILHAIYPNWTFKADHLSYTFNQAVALEDYLSRKLIDGSYTSLRSMRSGSYDWLNNKWIPLSGSNWFGASTELIAYYMDPRNFLNANDIYYFLHQGYDSTTQNINGVSNIINNTFLNSLIDCPGDSYHGYSYAQLIFDAGVKSGVNPYFLAATIIQEQGSGGSTLSKGYNYNGTTVYNFFNWKANGSSTAEILQNGGKFAYEKDWTTPSAAIIGGAEMYSDQYLQAGQNTYFYKNFNVCNPDPNMIWHQYAQNVADGHSSAKSLAKNYVDDKTTPMTFIIPVYEDNSLPASVSPYPGKNNFLNNYYFNLIKVDGLTPAFERYTYEYSLSVSGDTKIYVELPSGASIANGNCFNLNKGDNVVTLSVRAQTGFTKDYKINVNASVACKLSITGDINDIPQVNIIKGDTNGDGKVTLSDLANIRLYLLKKLNFTGNDLKGADTNGDGTISLSDLANIRLVLLGKLKLN